MSAAEAIAGLDDALDDAAQPVTLNRLVGTGPSATNVQHVTRARVRTMSTAETASGKGQQRVELIMSPSDLGGWGEPIEGQRVIVNGRSRDIDIVRPRRIGAVLVRLEIEAVG